MRFQWARGRSCAGDRARRCTLVTVSSPPDRPSSLAAWLIAQATYPILFATFIGVSGGFHPDPAGVVSTVATGAALVALVNLPRFVHLARRWPEAPPRWPPPRGTAGFVARLGFAAWTLHAIAVHGGAAARRGYHHHRRLASPSDAMGGATASDTAPERSSQGRAAAAR